MVAGMVLGAGLALPVPADATIDHDELHYRDRPRAGTAGLADAACDRGAARWAGIGLVVPGTGSIRVSCGKRTFELEPLIVRPRRAAG
jgi:hypothetical protein